jgi:CRP/FNR family transcriptional regulator, cyclic AMP receptor protein
VEKDIEALLTEHPFFKDMAASCRGLIAGCGKNVRFEAGQLLAKTEDPANEFFAIRHGRVSIELHSNERGPLILQTLEAGDVAGWSWLFPPYHWKFDVRALEQVRAISFDGECLRGKCERDPAMGYDFMKRFARVFMERLEATRLQLLDLYGNVPR